MITERERLKLQRSQQNLKRMKRLLPGLGALAAAGSAALFSLTLIINTGTIVDPEGGEGEFSPAVAGNLDMDGVRINSNDTNIHNNNIHAPITNNQFTDASVFSNVTNTMLSTEILLLEENVTVNQTYAPSEVFFWNSP